MKLVQFTHFDGSPQYVNPDAVQVVLEVDHEQSDPEQSDMENVNTLIYFGPGAPLYVTEHINVVLERLLAAE